MPEIYPQILVLTSSLKKFQKKYSRNPDYPPLLIPYLRVDEEFKKY